MKKFILFISFCSLVLLSFPAFAQTQKVQIKVVGVVDGDTITALMKDKSQKTVHIKGIDAPELEQVFGEEAREKLSKLILDKNVFIEYSKPNANREILGKVFLNGEDIALVMLGSGLAWFEGEQEELLIAEDETVYNNLENKAQKQLIGLWQDAAPQPPWEFRKTYVPVSKVRKHNIKTSTTFEGQVMEVIDGASIALKMSDNSRLPICINRLETPEPGQPKADIAEQHLKDLLMQKNVSVTISGFPEDENCIGADVYLNGININLQMVRDGVAWVNKNYHYPEGYYTYEAAEQAAKSERRGIWEDPANAITPSWIYRARYYRDLESSNSSFSYGGNSNGSASSGNKTVRVRAYTRSDGTQVRSHTRSAPGSGGGRSRSSGGKRN